MLVIHKKTRTSFHGAALWKALKPFNSKRPKLTLNKREATTAKTPRILLTPEEQAICDMATD